MILQQLAQAARERVTQDKLQISPSKMQAMAQALPVGDFPFERALKHRPAFICEVKRASPSKGIIAQDFPYLDIATAYVQGGATCLSVLTEPQWFLGSDQIFGEIRAKVSLPMLRKDFTVDEYQIYQSKTMGADCILLICALLDTPTIKRHLALCDSLGLSALVETHDEAEIASALAAGARIVGVNNRNLKDFSVNLSNASCLRKHIPNDVVFVAESGVATPADGIALLNGGADALLVGEALMRAQDKGAFLSAIREGIQ